MKQRQTEADHLRHSADQIGGGSIKVKTRSTSSSPLFCGKTNHLGPPAIRILTPVFA